MSYVGTGFSPLTDEARHEKVVLAILNSLDTWIAATEEISDAAIPFTGNKQRALHLQRSMLAAKQTLRNIAGLPED